MITTKLGKYLTHIHIYVNNSKMSLKINVRLLMLVLIIELLEHSVYLTNGWNNHTVFWEKFGVKIFSSM